MATQTVERLIASLEARTRDYEKGLAKAQAITTTKLRAIEREISGHQARQARAWSGLSGIISRQFGVSIAAITAGAVIGGLRNLAGEIGNIADNAKRAGVSIEDFQKILVSARQEGIGQDELAAAFFKFSKVLGEAQAKGNDLKKIFEANGKIIKDDVVENFEIVVDLINKAKNDQDQAVIGAAAFGKGYATLIPLIERGSQAIREGGEAAKGAGAIIEDELVKAADEFDERWTAVWDHFVNKAKRNSLVAVDFLTRVIQAADAAIRRQEILNQRITDPRILAHLNRVGRVTPAPDLEVIRAQPGTNSFKPAPQEVNTGGKGDFTIIPDLGEGGGGGEKVKRETEDMTRARKALTEQNKALLESEQALLENLAPFKDALSGIFSDLRNGVSVVDSLTNALNNLADQLANMALDQLFTLLASTLSGGAAGLTATGRPGALTFGGPRASGGPVNVGKAYKVGERGVETFVPSVSGRIVPNQAAGANVEIIDQRGVNAPPIERTRGAGGQDRFIIRDMMSKELPSMLNRIMPAQFGITSRVRQT